MKKYIFYILLIFTSNYAFSCEDSAQEWTPEHYSEKYTVKGPYSIKKIESRHTYTPAGEAKSLPFGSSNKIWMSFKKIYNKGDQLYYIKLELGKSYIEKYIIVRDRCVVGKYLLSSNGIVQ